MPEYECEDGPLVGQMVDWRDGEAEGQTLTICVVDVGGPGPDGDLEADYLVDRAPGPDLPGRLRFVAGRGAWREPALPRPVPSH